MIDRLGSVARPRNRFNNDLTVIRWDLFDKLGSVTKKLKKLRSNILLEIVTYPYVRLLQKQMLNIVADKDFLWMLRVIEEKEGNWRNWYYGVYFDLDIFEFFIEEGDHSKVWYDDLTEKYQTHLLKSVKNDLSKYDPFPRINYKFFIHLLRIYTEAFFVIFSLIVLIDRFVL